MKLKKQFIYNKNKVLLYMVLSSLLGVLSLWAPWFIDIKISDYALAKLVIFTTVMTLPFYSVFSCISAASFVYLLERFPRLQVVTVSLFIISYFEDFLDFEFVKVVAPLVTLISMIIFWRLKTTSINTFIFIVFVICSIITSLLSFRSFYDSPLFHLTKSEGYVEEIMDKIVYQTPISHLDKIRQAHKNLPDSYKLLDAKVRILEPGTIHSWTSKIASETFPSVSESVAGWAIYSLWGRNKVLLEVIDDELEFKKILIHELTHIKQFNKYGASVFLKPSWKIEGEAVIAENCFSNENIRKFLAKEKYIYPFKYKYFDIGRDDYKASQVQAWYYLKYLGISKDEFFDSRTKLAPWDEVKKAFLEHADS